MIALKALRGGKGFRGPVRNWGGRGRGVGASQADCLFFWSFFS